MVNLFFKSTGIKKKSLRTLVWEFCYRGISTPLKYEEFNNELEIANPHENFSEKSMKILEEAKVKIKEEVDIRNESLDLRDKARDEIVKSFIKLIKEHKIEPYHDEALFNLLERWNRFYRDYMPEWIELTNYLFFRIPMTLPSFRSKAYLLLFKTYRMMINSIKDSGMEVDAESPFFTLGELIKSDEVYAFMKENKQKFAKDLIELIMTDWGKVKLNKILEF